MQTPSSANSGFLKNVLRRKTFAEFFAGIGLMRVGLEKEGWSVAFANDIASEKRDMYAAHFGVGESHYLVRDIHELGPGRVPRVTLATASFPCNDLSLAGMRKGLGGKQSSAYWGFVRILDEMNERRPPIALLENVAGFLTSHGGRDFQAALLALNRLGYVVDPMIIDAARFLPQSRVRLFVVGMLQDGHGSWETRESPASYESEIRPKPLADFVSQHPEIAWRIREMPELPKRSRGLEDILEDLPDNSPFWWNAERRDYLVNQMSGRHAEKLGRMTDARKWSFGTVFRRVRNGRSMAELRTDGIAGCLRTPRGGSGRQILVQAGYGKVKVRLLTPRECARLMGADDFLVDAPLNKALFGFGDAVCAPVISWIARHCLNPAVEEMLESPTMNEQQRTAAYLGSGR
ncbi:MAG TPA: DNA (cytosine-5-)-methyltransferase [Sumerlaeia bacterium]|nr:DNA (cytosine-5-)-methyltransferase [Sumerlaeia bacterium]